MFLKIRTVDTDLPRPLPAETGAAAWGPGSTSVAYKGVCVSLAPSESPGAVRCPPLEPLSVHCAGQRENQPRLRDDAEAETWETTRPTSRLPDAHSALAARGPQSASEDVLLLWLGVSSLFRKEAREPLSLSGPEETSASFLGPDDSQAATLPAAPWCSMPGTWPHLILPAALRGQSQALCSHQIQEEGIRLHLDGGVMKFEGT
ncbi:uncharacterized protein LOC132506957 [Lagenorhynchus albirostris]|uniref:uncharacterized protein LOC132506957 n=1 Tax=Lagenorhynchus albirostris TaxID=27610 RepID=UPI0028E8F24E|nr:uncharacterized protein LOC132506957 [Lagenorhynchus albirostris]